MLILVIAAVLFREALAANCPGSWFGYGDNCYLLGNIQYKQSDARDLCHKRQAELVSFNTKEEREFIEGLVGFNQLRYWIGTELQGGKWVWLDGSKPDPEDGDGLVNWEPGHPNGGGDCAAYEYNPPAMRDNSCGARRLYLCKRRNDILDLCNIDDDWHDFDGMCFKHFDQSRNWKSAKSECESKSSTLAILNTEDKHDVFKEVVSCKDYEKGVWIGLSDTETTVENTLQWTDGSAIGSATNWDDGQPNFVGNLYDNCVQAFTASSYRWKIDTCGSENEYVCEKPQGECAPGWRDYGTGFCYLMRYGEGNIHKLTWTDAAKECSKRGAQLMKITNDEEQAALEKMGKEMNEDKNIWNVRIGVSDQQNDNTYRWQDGSAVTYNKFNQTIHEKYPNRMDCGYVKITPGSDFLWGTRQCFDDLNYICQIPIHTAPSDPVEEPEEWTCPYEGDWELDGQHCYTWAPVKPNYHDAKQYCQTEYGAEMTSIRNVDEMSFTANKQRGKGRIWISLIYRNGNHEWEDGSQFSFKNWDLNEPNNPASKECVVQNGWQEGNHMWFSETCDWHEGRHLICRRPATHIDPTYTSPAVTVPGYKYCGPGDWHYNPLNNMCYKLRFDKQVTWEEALNECRSEGDRTDLVSIHNFSEKTFLFGIIAATLDAAPTYWIGLNELDMSAGWTWSDGSPNEFFYWADGEPNDNSGEEFCNEMSIWNDLGWNDVRCSYEFSFICQKPGNDYMSTTTVKPPTTIQPLQCNNPEKMISGTIYVPDELFRASSWETNREPYNARLEFKGEESPYWRHYGMHDCKGNDIARLQTQDYDGCQKECEEREECVGVTYVDSWVGDDNCFPKRSCNPAPGNLDGLITGIKLFRKPSWTPSTVDERQWIEARLHYTPVKIIAIRTQGAEDREEWVTKYEVLYRVTPRGAWQITADEGGNTLMTGNSDKLTIEENVFDDVYLAKWVRVYPKEWSGKPSLRFEIMACQYINECNCKNSLSDYWRVDEKAFTASDFAEGHEPWKARNNQSDSAWMPTGDVSGAFLQVDLQTVMTIGSFRIRGRKGSGQWVTGYKMRYSLDGYNWDYYQEPYGTVKIMKPNMNNDDQIATKIAQTRFEARYLQYEIEEWHERIALRVETCTCQNDCTTIELIDGNVHKLDDLRLTASSSYDGNSGPDRSRLNTIQEGNLQPAWIPGANDDNQWIQADFGYLLQIRGIGIQGRGNQDHWVTAFTLKYTWNYGSTWNDYNQDGEVKVFSGSYNRGAVIRQLIEPHHATAVRLCPTDWFGGIALRWEVYGCPGSAEAVGCFADVNEDRDLPYVASWYPPGGMTHDICTDICYRQGYLYAGVQFGSECFCGNSYGKYGPSNFCTMPCSGDHTEEQICGGANANSIFTTGLSPAQERCPIGWKEYMGRCFQFNTDVVSWHDASLRCREQGGALATISNEYEQQFLASQLATYESNMWIGFHCLKDNFAFEWDSGQSVLFTFWDRREPSGSHDDEDCVMAYYDKAGSPWNDDPCSWGYGYVCEKSKENQPGATVPPVDDGCGGDGWAGYRWKCFAILSAQKKREDQKQHCENLGGNLVRIEDSQEQSFLQSHIAMRGGKFWTDLNDIDQPGYYVYSDGQQPWYTSWANDQPDKVRESSCVYIDEDDHTLWYDESCDMELGAICEKDREGVERPSPNPSNAPGNCANGWRAYGNWCYQAFQEGPGFRKTFEDALFDCEKMGGSLTSIHSQEENDFIFGNGVINKNDQFWIGLNRVSPDQAFTWTDQESAGFFNWDDDQPTDGDLDNCVQMSNLDGTWSSVPCSNTKNWICRIRPGINPTEEASTSAAPSAGPPGSCEPDDDNWKFFEDRCYYVSTGPVSWWNAESFCMLMGGYLASVPNENVNNFIKGQVRNVNAADLWIGLSETAGNGWQWSDGSPTDYINWGEGEPSEVSTKLCVGYQVKSGTFGTWSNQHCSNTFPFMCAKTKGTSPITTPLPTPMPGFCPDGYLPFRNKCFKFVDEKLSWGEASIKCKENGQGYDLASISNLEEQGFITSNLLFNQQNFWIGLHQFTSGQFGWSDNSPVTFTYWSTGEPNGGDEEQCVEMYWDYQHAGRWNDAGCGILNGYICMTLKSESNPAPEEPPSECPQDYYGVKWNGDCYKYASGNERTWQEGEDHCMEEELDGRKGHIASVLSPYEQGFMFSVLYDWKESVQEDSQVWIGLTDKDNPGRYQWSDGNTVIYTNWGMGQPNKPDGGCVYFDYKGSTWFDVDCNQKVWTMCKIASRDPIYTRPPVDGGCPTSAPGEDWIEYGENCYLFMPEKVTFSEARHQCYMRNSQFDLTSIHSEEENQFILDHIKGFSSFHGWWWTGLLNTLNGGFAWTDSTPVEYTNWAEGEPSDPDGTDGEHCVEMYTTSGLWNDVSCTDQNGYVCMAKRGGFSTVTATPSKAPGDSTIQSTVISTQSTQSPTGDSGSTTDNPDIGRPGGPGNLSPGGIVGVVFFVIFAILTSVLVALFVVKRRQTSKPGIVVNGEDGFSNPGYDTMQPSDSSPQLVRNNEASRISPPQYDTDIPVANETVNNDSFA